MPHKVTFSDPDAPRKESESKIKEKFAATARAVREKFFARKKAGEKPTKPLTPMQRRMHSGGV